MTSEIVRRPRDTPPAAPVHTERDAHLSDRTRDRIAAGVAANTTTAYKRQWALFVVWCEHTGRVSLPATAETLAEYVTVLADHGSPHLNTDDEAQLEDPEASHGASPSTIDQAIAAIRTAHRSAGYGGQPDTAGARLVLRAHRRAWGRKRKASPVMIDPLRAMVATCDTTTLKGLRDRVVLVLGFALMARRSELVALDLDDVTETDDGLTVLIRSSKTDQDAEGAEIPIPYGQHTDTCPVRVVRAWRAALAEHGITTGRLLRSITRWNGIRKSLSAAAVNLIVQARAIDAGLPDPEKYSAHSLRAGGPSAAYRAGAPVSAIAAHGRWAEGSPVVLGYIRVEDLRRNNPLNGIGL